MESAGQIFSFYSINGLGEKTRHKPMIVEMRFKGFTVRLARHDLDRFVTGLMEAFGIGVTIQDIGNHTLIAGIDGAKTIRIVKGDLAVVGRYRKQPNPNSLKRLKLEAFYTNNRDGI